MPGRKHTPSLGEKAHSYSPGPVVQSSILKTISWINVTFHSSLTTNRSQVRKKALLFPLLFPRGYFFLPCLQRFLYGKSFSVYIVVRVSGISRCRLAYVPGDVITSRPLSMKNLPTARYFDFCFLYICSFFAFRMIAQGVGVLFDRISSKFTVQL